MEMRLLPSTGFFTFRIFCKDQKGSYAMRRFLILLLILTCCIAICAEVYTDTAPTGQPRKLTPEEQRQAGGWKRRGE